MAAVPPSVPSAVPSAVNTVPILTQPQLTVRKFYQSGGGSSRIPEIPVTEDPNAANQPANPKIGYTGAKGSIPASGSAGAPTVPVDGFLFKAPPIDPHYTNQYNCDYPGTGPKVNNPPTRGMWTFILTYLNHIAMSQNVENTGWKVRAPQQRTSVMRAALPPHGIGYAPETFEPRQMPQQPNSYKVVKATGTSPYGSGVLNMDTFGAGQTAGGVGGNQYTPQPGPPVTTSTANYSDTSSGMPTWG